MQLQANSHVNFSEKFPTRAWLKAEKVSRDCTEITMY